MKIFCTLWLQNIGVSRGGKTTKIHALVNEHFQLIGIAIKLLSKVALAGKKVLADKAFCSEEIREYCFPSRFKFRLYQHALSNYRDQNKNRFKTLANQNQKRRVK